MTGETRGRRNRSTPARGVRDRILDAALGLLHESGVQHLTQVNVAERAGVRQSHLTYYFPTRRDLLHAVVARGVKGAPYETHWAAGGPDAGPDALLERVAAAVADVEHMRLFVAMIVETDGDPALRALIVEATQRFEATLADALGGVEARERARHLLIAIWGLGLYEFAIRPSAKNDPMRSYVKWLGAAMGEATDGAAAKTERSRARRDRRSPREGR